MIRTATRRWVAAVAALALGLSLAAAAPASAAVKMTTLNYGIAYDPAAKGYDPMKTNGQRGFWEALYDGLFIDSANGKVKPSLVTSFSSSADNLKFSMAIRRGVKFSDGSSLTPEVVKMNLDRRNDTTLTAYGAFRKGGSYEIASVDVVNGNVVITWAKPQTDPTGAFTNETALIVSALGLGSPQILASAPYGSGPYNLQRAGTIKGNQYTLVKNRKHWNARAYAFTKIVYRTILNSQALANAVVSGQVDYALVDDNKTVAFLKARRAGLSSTGGKISMLLFWDKLGKNVPAFKDVRVRQAIGLAINRAAYVNALHKGDEPTANMVAKGFPGYLPSLDKTWGYNPSKARQLLADAGYANGFTFSVTTSADAVPDYAFLAKQLSAVGITMQPKVAASTDEIFAAVMTDGLGLLPGVTMTDPFGFIIGVLVNGFANMQKAQSPEIAGALGQYFAAQTAGAKKAALENLNTAVVTQAWAIPLLEGRTYVTFNAKRIKPVVFEQGVSQPRLATIKPL